MELRIENVPDELVREARMQALAKGTTLRETVIAGLRWSVGDVAEGEKEGTQVSPKAPEARRTRPRPPKTANKQPRTTIDATAPTIQPDRPARGKATVATVEPCRHGLYFHPGCTD
jgi:hypothetical protein